MNDPIGCAGVLIMPGDVLVGDGEGVVVILAQVAEKVAHEGVEQEQRELFFTHQVTGGAALQGVYPPDERTLAVFEWWRAAREERSGD